MANKEKQAENKEKIGIGAWLALIVLILVLSGAFRTAEGPIKVLDFTNLAGSFAACSVYSSSSAHSRRRISCFVPCSVRYSASRASAASHSSRALPVRTLRPS